MATVEENRKQFIGSWFGSLEVIAIGARKSSEPYYKVKCHECAKDEEMFGEAIFETSKCNITQGNKPCGCSRMFQYNDRQNRLRVSRVLSQNSDIEFLGFEEDIVRNTTKVILKCKEHGTRLSSTSVNDLVKGRQYCKTCRQNSKDLEGIARRVVERAAERFKKRMSIPYTLNCGIVVRIVEYGVKNSVVIEDDFGNRKTTTWYSVNQGTVSWPWNKEDQVAGAGASSIGDVYKISSGICVTTTKVLRGGILEVADQWGNKQKVRRDSLVNGNVAWRLRGRAVLGLLNKYNQFDGKFKVGSKWSSDAFGDFKILSLNQKLRKVIIMWDNTGHIEEVSTGLASTGAVRDSSICENFSELKLIPEGYYVYVAHSDGVVYYVGSGSKKRYYHVNSGISHNYKLNSHHFSDLPKLDVYIHTEGLTKESSLELEKSVIQDLKPKYNFKPANNTSDISLDEFMEIVSTSPEVLDNMLNK